MDENRAPLGIWLISLFSIIECLIFLLSAGAVMLVFGAIAGGVGIVMALLLLSPILFAIVTSIGLLRLKRWSRIVMMVLLGVYFFIMIYENYLLFLQAKQGFQSGFEFAKTDIRSLLFLVSWYFSPLKLLLIAWAEMYLGFNKNIKRIFSKVPPEGQARPLKRPDSSPILRQH
ncbi:MAG: hypothetical protein Q7S65_04355 [Nanoarchaeota archaeon]|nr:hypothetical protein [Nanoarchaeota archaeon]